MKRRLFTILSAVSLLLCAAVLALWVMSYTASAKARRLRLEVMAGGGTRMHVVELRHGMVEYGLARRTTAPPARGAYAHVWNFPVPLAAPGAALLCVTLVLIRWYRRLRQRDDAGLCPGCGYDLRATPERCPECGTVIQKARLEARGRG